MCRQVNSDGNTFQGFLGREYSELADSSLPPRGSSGTVQVAQGDTGRLFSMEAQWCMCTMIVASLNSRREVVYLAKSWLVLLLHAFLWVLR